MKLSKVQLAIAALIVTSIIWGGSFPIYKWSLENIEPFTFAFIRFFIAALIILPFTKYQLKIDREDYGTLVALSLTGITMSVSFWFLGLQLAPSINGSIIASTGPIFLLLFAALFLKEKLQLKTIIGTLISLTGVLFIVLRPALENNASGSIIGNIFFILATLTGIAHVIFIKRIALKYNLITLTFWSFLIGAIALLPMALVETYNYGFLNGLNYQGIIGLLYGTLLSSVVAYLAFAFGLKYIKANEAGVFSYIQPIVAALIALPLLHEEITVTYLAGTVLVFLGIYIAEAKIHIHPFHR